MSDVDSVSLNFAHRTFAMQCKEVAPHISASNSPTPNVLNSTPLIFLYAYYVAQSTMGHDTHADRTLLSASRCVEDKDYW